MRVEACVLSFVAAPLFALAAGCDRPVASHVVARVNGAEITAAKLAPASRQAAQQALERVIDQELLVQQALQAGLDRDPKLAQAIDDARRQILAQAWLQRAAARDAGPSTEEVRAFYKENPALFAERRVYRMRQLRVRSAVEGLELLKGEAARAKDLEDVALWVSSRGLKYRISSITESAEEVPLAELPELSRMREGELAVFGSPLGTTVVQLVQAEPAPLSEAQARMVIEQFLAGRKRLERAAVEVKRLRQLASIEYVGEFKRN